MLLTLETIKLAISKKSYKWYTDRPNIIGIRTKLDVPDSFNDILTIAYPLIYKMADLKKLTYTELQKTLNDYKFHGKDNKVLTVDGNFGTNSKYALSEYEKALTLGYGFKAYTITTDPGKYWLNHPMSTLGTAILTEGQHIDSWSIGYHQSKKDHRALVQTAPVTVYRDNNKNAYIDKDKMQTGLFGINIHGANKNANTITIGKWSAGCQVHNSWANKEEMIDICDLYKNVCKNKFTYTLLNEVDLY